MTRVLFCSVLFCVAETLRAQPGGVWEAPFNHESGTPRAWTQATPPNTDPWPQHGVSDPPSENFNAVHMALIPRGDYRGKVVVWDYVGGRIVAQQRWSIVDPDNGLPGGLRFINRWLAMPAQEGDLFCPGLAWTRDGRLFVAGGTTTWPGTDSDLDWPPTLPTLGFGGGRMVWLLDPTLPDATGYLGKWTRLEDMRTFRWYPTVTFDGQDRLIIWGGTHNGNAHAANSYEALELMLLSDPPVWQWDTNNANTDPQKRVYSGPVSQPPYFNDYPRVHNLTDGQQFYSGFEAFSVKRLHQINPLVPPGPWDTSAGNGGGWGYTRYYGSHFVLPNPTPGAWNWIVRTGGYRAAGGAIPTNSVDICNAGVAWPWGAWHPMNFARDTHNTVILPDGTVIAIGGRQADVSPYACQQIRLPNGPAVRTPEILSASGWTMVAAHASPRVYHSAAILLPDARVLVAGGECRTWDYEVYRPPYLTNGKPRPTGVQVSQESLTYNTQYSVSWLPFDDVLATVDKVVLVRPGAVTHHTDMDQRYIELVSQLDTSTDPPIRRFFLTPPNSSHAPRGWYMLFLLTNDKVPSVAAWVNLQ